MLHKSSIQRTSAKRGESSKLYHKGRFERRHALATLQPQYLSRLLHWSILHADYRQGGLYSFIAKYRLLNSVTATKLTASFSALTHSNTVHTYVRVHHVATSVPQPALYGMYFYTTSAARRIATLWVAPARPQLMLKHYASRTTGTIFLHRPCRQIP